MIARLFLQPVTSLLIAGLWITLHPGAGAGTALLAVLLGFGLPLLTRRFWPSPPRMVRPLAALRLVLVVLADIVSANFVVAAQVLGPPARLRPAQFTVPLDIADPFVATLLGGIISLTPGTVTIDIEVIDGQARRLFVHGLDVPDADAAVAAIKARYEAPLKEMFRC